MSVAKVIELTGESSESFEDAIQQAIDRATDTLENVEGAWVKEQKVDIEDGQVAAYRVDMKISFIVQ